MNEPTLPEESLFLQALEYDSAEERAAFLDRECGANAELRRGVEALLHHHREGNHFLESPPTAVVPGSGFTAEVSLSESAGTQIGPYKLLEQIGEGGMGTVWMAQQCAPVKRLVALKLIKAGMDSRQVIARFEAERQALALMDHPNIARVLDAGTTSTGRPYFVMDLVRGVPITRYCDEHHLTPRQRLELFIPVCQAIQHAHQKGIIHRDLKPSNVLVALYDGKPVPKVIDFGVAKAAGQPLTEQTLVTGFGNIIGTLEYMSPEQAELNQLDIDTRSDIYSLGVLLYELLTGTPPFSRKELEQAGMLEMLRVIREQEPSKPSTKLSTADGLPTLAANRGTEPAKLTKLIRGELDWIVMKSLEKDRGRRYETANGFAMDVQRYLADEPVQACPPSTAYWLRKFTRRNKAALALSTAVMVALMVVIGAVGWTLRDRAARETLALQERAHRRARVSAQVELAFSEAKRAREQALTLTGDPYQWKAATSAARFALKSATGIAAQDHQALSPEMRNKIEALESDLDDDEQDRQFAARFDLIRLEQSDLNPANYSFRLDSAYPAVQAALQDSYQIQIGSTPVDVARRTIHSRPPAVQKIVWASLEVALANAPSADTVAREWLKEILKSVDDVPWRQRARESVDAGDWDALAALVGELTEAREPAADLLRLAIRAPADSPQRLAMLERIHGEYPGDFWANYQLAISLAEQSPPQLEDATRYLTAAHALRPTSPGTALKLGELLLNRGRHNAALEVFQNVVTLEPDFDFAHLELGLALIELNRLDEAETEMRRAIQIRPDFPGGTWGLGLVQHRRGELVEAESLLRTAVERGSDYYWFHFSLACVLLETARPADAEAEFHKATSLDPRIAMGHFWLGRSLEAQGKLEKAQVCYLEAIRRQPGYFDAHRRLAELRRTRGTASEDESLLRASPEQKPDDEDVQLQRALLLKSDGKYTEAETILSHALRKHPENVWLYFELAQVLASLKRPAEAEMTFREGIRLNPRADWLHESFAWFLRDQNKLQQAEEEFREAIRLSPSNPETHFGLANVLRKQQKFVAAEEECNAALRLEPNHCRAKVELGRLYLDQQRWSDAELTMRAALSLNPEKHSGRFVSEIQHNLGWAIFKQKRLSAAEGPLREAVRIDPEYDAAQDALGWLFVIQEEFAEAETRFREAIRLNPQKVSAYHGLGRSLIQLGRHKEAETYLEEALKLQPDSKYVPSLLKQARDGQRRSAKTAP
jgi:tetratricopeptide (TPR) repeat protein/serine/threonine protein kinase